MRTLAAVVTRLRAANTYHVDAALAAAVAVPVSAAFASAWSGPPGTVTPLGGLLNAGTVVPLVWRRKAPFAVAVTVALFAILVSAYHRPGQELQYGALVATYTVADLARLWQRWAFLGSLLAVLLYGSLFVKHASANDFMLTLLLPVSAYLLGTLARVRRARTEAVEERAVQLARGREAEAARAAAEERARIARDMHDILAHAISTMVVQAEAGPVVVRTSPARAERAFEAIAEAGRDSMVQLRRLLGVLDDKPETGVQPPPPTVAAVPALVARMNQAGLCVDLETLGEPQALPADTGLAAYRIVQEALTNTLKHAGARSATVQLRWTLTDLRLTVIDDGRGGNGAAGRFQGGGHGLIGIRERAAACGGHAETGPGPHGGFQVTAHLPYSQTGQNL
jgi:signal transduction histidine kinase